MAPSSSEKTKRRQLLDLIRRLAFKSSPTAIFPLVSGAKSKYYIDCKKALSHAEVRQLIGSAIMEQDWLDDIDAVGGLELGAYPVAIAISDALHCHKDKNVRVFVVRKKPKGHGLKKWVEGDVRAGDRVLIVDDVVTSGQSTLKAIRRSLEEDLQVIGTLAVIDREEGARANFDKAGVRFESLLTLKDLAEAAPKR